MVSPSSRDQPIDLVLRIVLAVADDADLGAERADRLDLVLRHQPRHADHGAHAFQPAPHRRARGHDCRSRPRPRRAAARSSVKCSDGVGGAAQLEAAGGLPVLELEKDRQRLSFPRRTTELTRGVCDHLAAMRVARLLESQRWSPACWSWLTNQPMALSAIRPPEFRTRRSHRHIAADSSRQWPGCW